MMRPVLEVADVFRHHGAAFRDRHDAHLGRVERRVMAAIEPCRTPALGGHVEQCGDCGLVRCAYNSCLMGKFSNGESRAVLPGLMLLLDRFALHYRVIPEQGD
jgi:Transposase zinc-binding domain